MIRKLTRRNTDFLILTETRAAPCAFKKVKIKCGLIPSQHSLQEAARAGVIIYSRPDHKIIEDSLRTGATAGHLAAAVYEVHGSRTIVAGVYGPSESNDKTATKFIQELSRILRELKHIYRTQHIIIAGDFNAVWRPEDANSHHRLKPRTTGQFNKLMEDHNLTDLAFQTNRTSHTWYRQGRLAQSSRIDYILTSIPTQGLDLQTTRTNTQLTTFDHVFLEATFGQKITPREMSMKDYILGSEEYIITSMELVAKTIRDCAAPEPRNMEQEEANEPQENIQNTADQGYTFNQPERGITALHTLNTLIQKLQQEHNRIAKERSKAEGRKLQEASRTLFELKKQLKKERREEEQQALADQISTYQRELSNDIEAKDLASQLRIKNFYLTGNGTMKPQTFYCIKERNKSRKITKLVVEGREITDQEEIIQVMQSWYEDTAMNTTELTMTLQDFLNRYNIQLPQITEDQKEEMEEEFTQQEVKEALHEAAETSAPGPSGQTSTFFKLLFTEAPKLFTEALNQLVFMPELGTIPLFHWIKKRKVIYIPKKNNPTSPGDYRPLSMLEVLYKIPSRILSKRINRTLPTIIGPHQHGFMQQKGIQEPSLIATHLIQDANLHNKPLQLLSLDIEKAFDRLSHSIIIQALRAFGFPEIYTRAIEQYILIGFAFVEVNGKMGAVITIKTGSGQGDPMSSSLFLVGSEPFNLAISQLFRAIMYQDRAGLKPGPILFADDNLNPLALRTTEEILPLLNIYSDYQKVSGLNINMSKSKALCINTSEEVQEGLQNLQINTPTHVKHLGIYLGENIQSTVNETMRQTEVKAIKRRILATTPPTDLLHRALLVNTAFTPIYNHILMALPIPQTILKEIDAEVGAFFWTRQKDGETKQKRKLVAKSRISAEYNMGGLKVPTLQNTAEGFRLNLLQRTLRREEKPTHFPKSLLPEMLNNLLAMSGRPSLAEHVDKLGPSQWTVTANLIKESNSIYSQAFRAGSQLIQNYEKHKALWHHSPIVGHTMGNLFPITTMEAAILSQLDIVVVGQLFEEGENGTLRATFNSEIELHPDINQTLSIKLKNLHLQIKQQNLQIGDIRTAPITITSILMRKNNNISITHKKRTREILTDNLKTAPAYNTRTRDNIWVPDKSTFNDAYKVLNLPIIPSKTKEVAFQTLNRTIWTNNKAFKSGTLDNPACLLCGEVETMEHLLYNCTHSSTTAWAEFSGIITELTTQISGQTVARMNYTPNEIIYNIPHPTILLRIEDAPTRELFILLTQEVKRDLIYRRMNIREHNHNRPTPLVRVQAHILSIVDKIKHLLEYQGIVTNKKTLHVLSMMKTIINNRITN